LLFTVNSTNWLKMEMKKGDKKPKEKQDVKKEVNEASSN
jgi:hypothetical protein